MSGHAHRVGHPGDLLFELALGRVAPDFGWRVCGVRDLGVLAVTPTAYAPVDAATGEVAGAIGLGLDQAFAAAAHTSVDTVVMADYELAGLTT